MEFQGIHDRLRAVGAPGLSDVDLPRPPDPEDKKDKGRAGDAYAIVDPQQLPAFLETCRDDPKLRFEILMDLTATDPKAEEEVLWINVQLLSVEHRHRLAIKCHLLKADAQMPTSSGVYRSAQWFERECAEMFGVTFTGHPDPRHMLLPDDWGGNPLRKDYEYPKEYRGVSCE